MYVPQNFAMDDEAAWTIVEEAGAGTLVVSNSEGLSSVFVPVIVSDDRTKVFSHVAKANGWWKGVRDGSEVLALFVVASAYVSPSNYPSRLENPGVVPTWNYVAAEVRGHVTLHQDPQWKLNQVSNLTEHFEHGREPEWRVRDTDEHYRDAQLRAIVGVEIDVIAIQGKAKLSQNRPGVDHDQVRANFATGTLRERNVARRMRPHG